MNDSVGIFSVYGCIYRGRKKLSTDQGEGCGGGNGNESGISCRTNLVDPWLSSYTHHCDPLLPTCETHGDWWWGGKQVGENWKAHIPPSSFLATLPVVERKVLQDFFAKMCDEIGSEHSCLLLTVVLTFLMVNP